MNEPRACLLVVDDEAFVLDTLQSYLVPLGYRVLLAADGVQALACCRSHQVDLVLTDLHMPEMDGFGLLAELQRTDPYLPVIFISGQSSLDVALECLRRGAADYIAKPFQLDHVRDLVAATLARRRLLALSQPREGDLASRLPPGYDHVRTLGEGTHATVVLARAESLGGALCALKLFRLAHTTYEEQRELFRRFSCEIEAASRVCHPYIVRILDYGTTPRRHAPYVAMEYVPGQPLDFFIRHDVLSLAQRVRLLAQLAEAIAAIHAAGICHRDIKPANVLVTEELTPKLTDFGIARLPNSEVTRSGQVLGSPAYMAPEAFLSARLEPQADLFSFGIVAYEVLHGQRLYTGDTLLELMQQITAPDPLPAERLSPDLSLPLAAILLRCLARRPEDRFPSAGDLASALQAALARL